MVTVSPPTIASGESHANDNGDSASRAVICVFCGASPGTTPAHLEAARALAHVFHERNISLVYGGGGVGLMGEVAKTLVKLAGPDSVHGVIPATLIRHDSKDYTGAEADLIKHIDTSVYGNFTVVKDMHTRKALMAQKVYEGGPGSGFIALSGGYGTMEELMEMTTWNQLGIHSKGVAVYNVDGFWDGILQWVRTAVQAGFVKPQAADIIVEGKTAEEVVDKLFHYRKSEGQFKLKWEREVSGGPV